MNFNIVISGRRAIFALMDVGIRETADCVGFLEEEGGCGEEGLEEGVEEEGTAGEVEESGKEVDDDDEVEVCSGADSEEFLSDSSINPSEIRTSSASFSSASSFCSSE